MKQKQLALTLVVVLLLGMLCACAGHEVAPSGSDSTPADTSPPAETSTTYKDALSGTNFDPDDIFTWLADTPSYLTEEDVDKIYPGMTLLEVFRTIGLPQRDVSMGNIILEWDMVSDMYLRIGFRTNNDVLGLPVTMAEYWEVMSFSYISRDKPQPTYNPADKSTWFSKDTPSYPTAEDIAKIQSGDTLQQVFCTIGLPQRDAGPGMLLEWDLSTGGHLQIKFVKNDAYARFPIHMHMEVESIELVEPPSE